MASVYGRLGFNFDANNTGILSLSEEAIGHLNSSPSFLPNEWQVTDLANSDTDGYYKNPTANVYTTMSANANLIYISATSSNITFPFALYGEGAKLANTANNYMITLDSFKSHTDNLTVNLIENGGTDAANFPYRQSALGYGKFLIYLTYQTDGISNASPALGSFTSLFVNDQLESNNTIIYNDFITLNNSISIVSGNAVSSLSGAAINVIISHIQTANTLIATRRTHDVQFFQNSGEVLKDFGVVAEFSNMGALDTNLANNYIGSDKLLTRLNS